MAYSIDDSVSWNRVSATTVCLSPPPFPILQPASCIARAFLMRSLANLYFFSSFPPGATRYLLPTSLILTPGSTTSSRFFFFFALFTVFSFLGLACRPSSFMLPKLGYSCLTSASFLPVKSQAPFIPKGPDLRCMAQAFPFSAYP